MNLLFDRPTREKIAALYATGEHTLHSLGEMFDCSYGTVFNIAQEYGVKKSPHKAEIKESCKKLRWQHGMLLREIAAIVDVSIATIWRWTRL